MAINTEGTLQPDGSWLAAPGSPHRSLTAQEVADLKAMAETTTPIFHDQKLEDELARLYQQAYGKEFPAALRKPHATWEEHHPLAREIFEKRGLKPKT